MVIWLLFEVRKDWASLVAQMVENLLAMQETWIQSIGWEDSLEKRMATHSTSVFLLGKFHGFGSLASYNPWGHQEMDSTEWLTLALSFKKSLEQHFEKSTQFINQIKEKNHITISIDVKQKQNPGGKNSTSNHNERSCLAV